MLVFGSSVKVPIKRTSNIPSSFHNITNDESPNMDNPKQVCGESVFMINIMCDKDFSWTHNKQCQHS